MKASLEMLFLGLVVAISANLAACGGDTVVVPAVPAEDGKPEIVIETANVDAGHALEASPGSKAYERAQTVRVQLKNGAIINAMTFCLTSSITKTGWRGVIYSGYPGVPQGYDENATPDGALIFSATPHDADNRVQSTFYEGALASGKTTIRIDTSPFAGLDEFFVDLTQGGTSDGRTNLMRLMPDANATCGATGVIVDGTYSRITVRLMGSEITTVGPPGSVYPQGGKG